MRPLRNLSSASPLSYPFALSILFATPRRPFEEVHSCLNKLGQRTFLKRYLRRNEILSNISDCNVTLNDAREAFGVSVVSYWVGHSSRPTLTRSSVLTDIYPDLYIEACQSHRAATARSARIALARFS